MSESHPTNRRPLIAANWKMNKTAADTETFIRSFLSSVSKGLTSDVVLCPPFTSLEKAYELLKGSEVFLGGQNLNENKSGAYTGEISGAMLKSVGCQYVIVGHSERRQYYGETDGVVSKKIRAAFDHGLLPIVCVGETLEEREANKTISVVSRQVKGALTNLPSSETQKVVLAYEPIWAIGTGKTATVEQAQEVHLKIRDILKDQYGSLTSLSVRILYGGSVKPDNMSALMACEDVDGGLVGGASLEAQSFLDIVNYKNLTKR